MLCSSVFVGLFLLSIGIVWPPRRLLINSQQVFQNLNNSPFCSVFYVYIAFYDLLCDYLSTLLFSFPLISPSKNFIIYCGLKSFAVIQWVCFVASVFLVLVFDGGLYLLVFWHWHMIVMLFGTHCLTLLLSYLVAIHNMVWRDTDTLI